MKSLQIFFHTSFIEEKDKNPLFTIDFIKKYNFFLDIEKM